MARVDPRAAAFKKGDRVRVLIEHFAGKDQRATVVEDGDKAKSMMGGTIRVALDGVKKRRVRYYDWTSLEKLDAVSLLGELG